MTTTRQNIADWFDQGVKDNTDFMIVVCDTYDYEDYPVYANKDNYSAVIKRFVPSKNMQKVMEIYDLSMDKDEQLNERRVWNAPVSNN